MNCGRCDDDDVGGGGGGRVTLVVVFYVVMGRVGQVGQGRMGMGRWMVGVEVKVVLVNIVVVMDSLGLFGCFLLIVSLQNDLTSVYQEQKKEKMKAN